MKQSQEYLNSNIKLTPSFTDKLAMLWSHKFALLGVTLSVIAVALIIPQVQKYQSLQTGATADPAEIFFNPATDSITTTEKTFPLWINSSTVGVSFANVEVSFDTTVLTLTKDPTPVNPSLTQAIEITTAASANSTGQIVITLGQDPNTATQSGAFQLATLSFKAKTTATANSSITISTANSQLVNNNAVAFALTSTPLALALNPGSGASLAFSTPIPVNPQQVNTPFTTNIIMDTLNQDTYGVDAVVKYDFAKLRLDLITPVSGNGFTSYPLSNINNSTGVAKFSANIGTGATAPAVKGSNISIAKLTFTPLSTSTGTNLTYDFVSGNRNDSNIILKNATATQDPLDILTFVTPLAITINAASTSSTSPTPSPSVSPPPSASPIGITFTFDFQGKTRAGVNKTIDLKVSYIKNNQGVPVNLNLTTNAAGQVTTSLLPGNYVFVVKAPGYLAKRFGTSTSPVIITSTTTTLDFASSPLLGGDLNGDETVNEVDYTLKFLTNFGLTTPLADLDSSGQVNTLDFAIMRGNWNLTDDTFQ